MTMTGSRRQFLRRTAAATGVGLTPTMFPAAIRKALAIAPRRRSRPSRALPYDLQVHAAIEHGRIDLIFANSGNGGHQEVTRTVHAGREEHHAWSLERSGLWYDFTVTVVELPGFSRRLAGRVESGRDTFSDPAMGGPARGDQE